LLNLNPLKVIFFLISSISESHPAPSFLFLLLSILCASAEFLLDPLVFLPVFLPFVEFVRFLNLNYNEFKTSLIISYLVCLRSNAKGSYCRGRVKIGVDDQRIYLKYDNFICIVNYLAPSMTHQSVLNNNFFDREIQVLKDYCQYLIGELLD